MRAIRMRPKLNCMQTIRLIYASVAEPDLDYEDLTSLLRRANDHNTARGITGILCYGNGEFLQALEGEREAVNKLYNSLVRDSRHHDCQVLRCEDIDARYFSDWSMMFIGWDDRPTAQRRALVLKHSGGAEFSPTHMRGEQALKFLCALADTERHHAV